MTVSRTEAQVNQIVELVQSFDDLLTVLCGSARHRRDVPADSPTVITPVWPWTPKHVAGNDQDAGDAA